MVTTDSTPMRTRLRSPGFKLFIIVLLTVLMAVPLLFIELALVDRQDRAAEAQADIASGWGGTQTVAGPILVLPYEEQVQSLVDGRAVTSTQRNTAILLPSTLALDTGTEMGTRWRGIFPVPVYKASANMRAGFDKSALAAAVPQGAKPLWNEAAVAVTITDLRGLAGNVTLVANGKPIPFQPGTGIDPGSPGMVPPGIHAPLGLDAQPDSLTLSTTIALRGSRELSFLSLGKQTTARLTSSWADPSFFGAFLPSTRTVGANGFDANWTVPYLARGFGQTFATTETAFSAMSGASFGVKFYQPVDFYQLVQRSLKYAILFVGLAYLVFFVAELIVGRRLHAAQYTLMGAAQVLFYLLLLSFAEHIGFAAAYVTAAAATVGLTAFYAVSAFASRARAAILFAVLGALYGLLYVILVQEDYALLIGALVLFFALGTTMYATRRLDWARIVPEPVT